MKTFSEFVVEEAALAWLGDWNLRDSLRFDYLTNLVAADDLQSAAAAWLNP